MTRWWSASWRRSARCPSTRSLRSAPRRRLPCSPAPFGSWEPHHLFRPPCSACFLRGQCLALVVFNVEGFNKLQLHESKRSRSSGAARSNRNLACRSRFAPWHAASALASVRRQPETSSDVAAPARGLRRVESPRRRRRRRREPGRAEARGGD